jgi:pyrroloquinoline quinone biosynthesis protein D
VSASVAPSLARGVRLRKEDGGIAFLLIPEGVVELGETALAIVELVDGARTVDEIALALAQRYDAPAGDVSADVRAFVDDFTERGYFA